MGVPQDLKILVSTLKDGFGKALTVMFPLKVEKNPGEVSTLQIMFFKPALE
jgi:hypothetical protein